MDASAPTIIEAFVGHESLVAAVAAYMRWHNLSPEQVLAEYDAWINARGRDVRQASVSVRAAARDKNVSVKGSSAQLARACPRCGGTVYLEKLCPRVSPRWRTQLACMRDGCDWHGLSETPISALVSGGAAAIKQHTRNGGI